MAALSFHHRATPSGQRGTTTGITAMAASGRAGHRPSPAGPFAALFLMICHCAGHCHQRGTPSRPLRRLPHVPGGLGLRTAPVFSRPGRRRCVCFFVAAAGLPLPPRKAGRECHSRGGGGRLVRRRQRPGPPHLHGRSGRAGGPAPTRDRRASATFGGRRTAPDRPRTPRRGGPQPQCHRRPVRRGTPRDRRPARRGQEGPGGGGDHQPLPLWTSCAGSSASCAATATSRALGPGTRARRARALDRAGAGGPGMPSSSTSAAPPCRRSSPGVELSIYRIVQEALTNVVKHAGPAVGCRSRSVTTPTPSSSRCTTTDWGPSRPRRCGRHRRRRGSPRHRRACASGWPSSAGSLRPALVPTAGSGCWPASRSTAWPRS